MSDQVDSMSVRMFLRNRMGVIDQIYLEHEGSGPVGGIVHCHCGYRAQEPEWLLHVADKIADVLEPPAVVELPLEMDDEDDERYRWGHDDISDAVNSPDLDLAIDALEAS